MRAPSCPVSSAVFFGLPDHRLLIESIDLVDQLIGEHVLNVHGALDQVLSWTYASQSGPRGVRRPVPLRNGLALHVQRLRDVQLTEARPLAEHPASCGRR